MWGERLTRIYLVREPVPHLLTGCPRERRGTGPATRIRNHLSGAEHAPLRPAVPHAAAEPNPAALGSHAAARTAQVHVEPAQQYGLSLPTRPHCALPAGHRRAEMIQRSASTFRHQRRKTARTCTSRCTAKHRHFPLLLLLLLLLALGANACAATSC
jgi:hypothetical protein